MKHYLTILFLLLTVNVIAQDKAPKLVLESFEHDLGRVKEGAKVTHSFILKNEGNADLQIEGVSPG